MKKLIGLFAAMVIMITTNAQKNDVIYENGWVDGSIKQTMGVYYAPDSAGTNYAVALKIEIDSIYFNGKRVYVDASQRIKNEDAYRFIASDEDGTKYEMVLRGDAYPKYHKYFLTIDVETVEGEKETIYGVLIKNITPGLIQETKWKQAWFDRMYSKAESKNAIAAK